METVTITIDGERYSVEKGIPLVLAAERAGVRIPHLCYYEGLSIFAGCRVCVVQIDGVRGLPTSCNTLTAEGQVVWTKTPEVLEMQRGVMSLILADHPDRCLSCHRQEHCGIDGICLRDAVVTYRCLTCAKNKRCEFQSTSEELGMHKYPMQYYQERHSWYGPDHVELPIKRDNPFIELDFNECILCARCVRACDEIRGLSCYEISYKGPQAHIDTAFGLSLQEVGCDGCGACVDACPVACILDKPSKWKGSAQRIVTTTCPNCGDGCQLDVQVKQDKILRVEPSKLGLANHGVGCARGRSGLDFVHDPARLPSPLVKRDGHLVEASWEEALGLVAERLSAYKGDQFAALASPRATNEENYLLQKFVRQVMGTNNIDHYTRLDHRQVVQGLKEALGYPAMTMSMDDIAEAKCLLVIGSDTAVTHPIAAWQARNAARTKGASLLVANPRYNEMVQWADRWLRYRPGTEVALLGGMMRVIMEEGLADQEFIVSRCEDLAALEESLKAFELEQVAEATGVAVEDIRDAARRFATSGASMVVYDTGITEYTQNQDAMRAIADLVLLTGNLGKPGAGIAALRSESNQQGTADLGCIPDYLPSYQPAPGQSGLGLSAMLEGAASGSIKAMLVSGIDPVADDPQRAMIAAALGRLDFLVALDSFLTPTARLADVVLPLATFAEQDGTYTNTERRIQRVRSLFEPVGDSRPGWSIIARIASRMGAFGFSFSSAAALFSEIASVTPIYGGVSYERLEQGGLQWPCPSSDHPGTPLLYADGFPHGKAHFMPIAQQPLQERVDAEYPLLLAAGRELLAYHKEVLTLREDPTTRPFDEEILRLHPQDALRFDIRDGERVQVVTRGGHVEAKALVTDDVPEGAVYLTVPILEDPSPLANGPMAALVDQAPVLKLASTRIEKLHDR